MSKPEIFVATTDFEKLQTLLGRQPESETVNLLLDELDRAHIVEDAQIPSDVVRMHSRVSFTMLSSGQRCTYSLVFPREVQDRQDALSVLSPVGSALLGLRIGDEIEWPLPGGKHTRIHIDELLPSPELV